MLQEIITYTIVTAAFGYAGFKFYQSVFSVNKAENSCGNCSRGNISCKTKN